jgi:hypothetical protein
MANVGRRLGVLGALVCASTHAWAQQAPPPKLWTQFETATDHVNVAGVVCALGATATLDGRVYSIALDAFEDGAELCAKQTVPGTLALTGRAKMTRAQPQTVVVELDVPPGLSPNATNDLRGVLQNMSADLARRASGAQTTTMAPPPPRWTPPPPVPTHPEERANVALIGAGFGMFGGGYLVQLFVGSLIATAPGDPGTGRGWPFVPVIGLMAFSTTYKEASGCDCETGRVFSIVGSVLVGALEVAGLVVGIYGLTHPRTKMVPNTVSIRIGPTGIEGTF